MTAQLHLEPTRLATAPEAAAPREGRPWEASLPACHVTGAPAPAHSTVPTSTPRLTVEHSRGETGAATPAAAHPTRLAPAPVRAIARGVIVASGFLAIHAIASNGWAAAAFVVLTSLYLIRTHRWS